MEKFVFKAFMDRNVVQKTIIFADAFNLNIEGWSPANTEAHPYRINFYSGKNIVGYIDAETFENGLERVRSDMPFVLYTPVGKLTGFMAAQCIFVYILENRNGLFKSWAGTFKVVECNKDSERNYFISSFLSLEDLENNGIIISFGGDGHPQRVFMKKSGMTTEEAELYALSNVLTVEHCHIPSVNQRQYFAKASLILDSETDTLPVDFEFLGMDPYSKTLKIEDKYFRYESWLRKLKMLEYSTIGDDIAVNDPRFAEFIEEIRSALTLPANGITPVCIYDKMAQLCFSEEEDKFRLDFTGAQHVEVALEHNQALKKMLEHKKGKNTF